MIVFFSILGVLFYGRSVVDQWREVRWRRWWRGSREVLVSRTCTCCGCSGARRRLCVPPFHCEIEVAVSSRFIRAQGCVAPPAALASPWHHAVSIAFALLAAIPAACIVSNGSPRDFARAEGGGNEACASPGWLARYVSVCFCFCER